MNDTAEEAAATRPAQLQRDPSGVPRLDEILGGGLPRGAFALVIGPPGSGKTTLAGQMAFAAARDGRKTLILTAFSEPVTKLLLHLRTLHFFDEDLVGDRLQVFSLAQFLPEGLATTADEIRTLIRRGRYRLIVLDGFRGIRVSGDEQGARRFLYEIGAAASAMGATTIVTSEAEPRDVGLYPEVTTADVLLGLHAGLIGLRETRHLEAIKVRGLARLHGLHPFTLTGDGITIFPRLEARVTSGADMDGRGEDPGDTRPIGRHLPFGLSELDALLGGGLMGETFTVAMGSPGVGKTLLALHWALAGAAAGEAAVYLGFREDRRRLLFAADGFGLGERLRSALAAGLCTIVRMAPVELEPDVLADALLHALDRVRAQRLVIDSIGELERAVAETSSLARVPGYLAALIEALRMRGVTAILIRESGQLVAEELGVAADTPPTLADNVLVLQHVAYRGRLYHVISAPKVRFSAQDLQIREFIIASNGIQVLAPLETTSGVLAGIAARQGGRDTRGGSGRRTERGARWQPPSS